MVRNSATEPPLDRSQRTDPTPNRLSTESILRLSDSLSWGGLEGKHRMPTREEHSVSEHPPVRAFSKAFQRHQKRKRVIL